MDKENVVYIYNEILLTLKKVGNPTIRDKLDEPERHYAK